MRGNVYIVSAPSGSGKTTLVDQLLRTFEHLTFSVSHTTRPPRGEETDGVEYHFVDRHAFQGMIERGEFLEWAEYQGHLYGTGRQFVENQLRDGKDVILDIDVEGARQVRSRLDRAISVFILPPSFPELERRLRARQLEPEEIVRKRLEIARREILCYRDYDYVIINDVLDDSLETLRSILRAVRCRAPNQEERIQAIIASFGGSA